MTTGRQIREAHAMLKWSVEDSQKRLSVKAANIRCAESR